MYGQKKRGAAAPPKINTLITKNLNYYYTINLKLINYKYYDV